MKPLFYCEINYFPSRHLNQIYNGFALLQKKGIVQLKVKRVSNPPTNPILTVIVNEKYKLIYDVLDGLNWIKGSEKDNLQYFRRIECDFYFKRSYTMDLLRYCSEARKVYPLGLNYSFNIEGNFLKGVREILIELVRKNPLLSQYYKKTVFHEQEFEYYPIKHQNTKILFLARLWNPNNVVSDRLKIERREINQSRIELIKACRKQFGDSFFGGLHGDDYSRKIAKELVIDPKFTRKERFLSLIKQHNICIATTGLHGSIGWKFGEYIAASRAIITEPLRYELPGVFEDVFNYRSYINEKGCVCSIEHLLNNPGEVSAMMERNYNYYNNYVRSDKLVLNTLLALL